MACQKLYETVEQEKNKEKQTRNMVRIYMGQLNLPR